MTAEPSAPELFYLDYQKDFIRTVSHVSHQVQADTTWQPDFVIGIGRGGLVPAVYISHQIDVPMLSIDHSAKEPNFAEELLSKLARMSLQDRRLLFVDDINDSGKTILDIRQFLTDQGCVQENLRFAVLISNVRSHAKADVWAEEIDRDVDKRWFVFPWEAVSTTETITADAQAVPERLA